MNQNQEVIIQFYSAFQKRDWRTMQFCYHAEAHFSDSVFPDLNSMETKAMWHMLCENAQDFSLQFTGIEADDTHGRCDWQAWYTFSRTGRKVHNIIQADFEFKDGLIIRHTDSFNFWRWSRMALGITGILMGWTPIIQNKVQTTARKSLFKFMDLHPLYKK
jgi:hypothetical protein